ncbi:hypothetical protein BU24DRAFT_196644 [Aaosphaeria arxii CBS 175.79]|uniref:Acid phosphatase-like protein n=1 Tax=Aaosphaeria arxii CBS 175.79 TaxID=1450172 RepID=A0A6A5XU07_9PLEO|nr:uncharacterized protein BU24DRAFT_196644 [Aaosphaeria arxii CBS 175.79]KAF2016201.1 hypothetical protein BU24DRAFT_196644 [Aaosphaeria arxii CBS 175.79]
MNGGWVFLIILIIALIGGYGGWVLWSRIRASRLGLPPPSLNPFDRSSSAPNYPAPAPGGIRGFIETQIRKFKNRNNRQAAGAYEEPSSSYNSARGRGAGGHRLDPDEAWSARVGDEAYYEEQELGLHAPADNNTGYHGANTGYGGGGATGYPGAAGGYEVEQHQQQRGRSRTREYEEESLHTDGRSARDPFGDDNAASLRGVSPRPLDHGQDTSYGGASAAGAQNPALKKVPTSGSAENSPTERRSMFRENM